MSEADAAARFFTNVTESLQAHDEIYLIRGAGLELYLLRDFLTDAECDQTIELIERDHRPSTVLGEPPSPDYRTSVSSPLANSGHPTIHEIDARIAALTGIHHRYQENIEGQRYAVGQQFMPHYDYFDTTTPYWPRQERLGGQRTWTVMICLNTPEAGGGTLFPNAGARIKPRRGNLLAWSNLDAHGQPNPQSLHCGEPIERGVKYILTKWHRERPFAPDQAVAGELESAASSGS